MFSIVVDAMITKLFRYLFNKRSEIDRLNFNDVLLTKLVLDIHRKRTGSRFEKVKLHSIEPVHPIDRESARAVVLERVKALNVRRDEILRTRLVDRHLLASFLPSISWIKVVRCGDERFVSFEGNGRIEALQRVFDMSDGIDVEAEVYYFKDMTKILRRINRVRRHYGVTAVA